MTITRITITNKEEITWTNIVDWGHLLFCLYMDSFVSLNISDAHLFLVFQFVNESINPSLYLLFFSSFHHSNKVWTYHITANWVRSLLSTGELHSLCLIRMTFLFLNRNVTGPKQQVKLCCSLLNLTFQWKMYFLDKSQYWFKSCQLISWLNSCCTLLPWITFLANFTSVKFILLLGFYCQSFEAIPFMWNI